MLYTVIPYQRIFREEISPDPKANDCIMLDHGQLEIKNVGDQRIINRLISGDPQDYLKDEYQPGKIYFD